MRIGITCFPTYGGSGVVGAELGLELARRGHSVHFIGQAPPARLAGMEWNDDVVEFHPVNMLAYPLFEYPPYALALSSKLLQVAEAKSLDLIHMHYAIPHAVSGYLAREMLKPVRYLPIVTTLHGTDITLVGRDQSFLPITRFGIEQSDGVTSISDYLRRATIETFGVGCEITVIHNFVDAEYYQRRPDQHLRERIAPAGEKIILHISTFRPVKRIMDCIQLMARLSDLSDIPARLVMCGDGPERAEAESLAIQLGVADSVIFAGQQPQAMVLKYLSLADVLLLPSQTESFGLSALEAMACEVPVVATRVGGIPEVVAEGDSGFLFEVGDVDGMARAVAELLHDQQKAERMGQLGREIATSRFSADQIIPQYEAFYARVAG